MVQKAMGEKGLMALESISKMAAQQGGENILDNYRLLGKRALIVAGVAIVAVEVVSSVASYAISRKFEDQRIEAIVRRVMEEERQKEAALQANAK
jgi:hypothetical protein